MSKLIRDIKKELKKAKEKHPVFPIDAIHQLSILSEEVGEAVRAANLFYLEGKGSREDVITELKQSGAMVLRCLENLP